MRYAIYGAGGCGRDVHAAMTRARETVEMSEIVFVDDALAGGEMCGERIIAARVLTPDYRVVIAIADGSARERLSAEISTAEFFAVTTLVSDLSVIAPGAVVSDYVIIGPRTTIGRQFQANYFGYVAHDCVIGNFVTFAPSVRCNGNVTIGDHAYIGTGAMIRQGITIGARAVVGMGAVVVKDVPEGATVMGNPAR